MRSTTWNFPHPPAPTAARPHSLSVCSHLSFQPTCHARRSQSCPWPSWCDTWPPSLSRIPTLHQYSFSLSLAQESVIHEAQACHSSLPFCQHWSGCGTVLHYVNNWERFLASRRSSSAWCTCPRPCPPPSSDLHPSGVSRHRSPDQAPGSAHVRR